MDLARKVSEQERGNQRTGWPAHKRTIGRRVRKRARVGLASAGARRAAALAWRVEVRSVEAIVRALNGAEVQYLIVGGLAVNAHGFVRLTRDIDIVLALGPENASKGLRTLLEIGYRMSIPATPEQFADAATRDDWRQNKQMIVLKLWSDVHQRTPVDIFVYEPFPFELEASRAQSLQVCPGVAAPVVSFETLLQMKRTAGRPHDLIDIEELQRMR